MHLVTVEVKIFFKNIYTGWSCLRNATQSTLSGTGSSQLCNTVNAEAQELSSLPDSQHTLTSLLCQSAIHYLAGVYFIPVLCILSYERSHDWVFFFVSNIRKRQYDAFKSKNFKLSSYDPHFQSNI